MIAAVSVMGLLWNTGPDTSSPTITEIQRLGELVVLRVSVADVLKDSGYEYKGVWIIRGDAQVAVDLREVKVKSRNEKTKKLVVVLPQPRVIQPRVDHDKSEEYKVDRATWKIWKGDQSKLSSQAWQKAQGIVETACSSEENMDQARDQTELMLTNMYRMVGWDVDVVWRAGS